MAEINRRKFLTASIGVGAAGLLAGAASCSWLDLQRAAERAQLPDGAGVLVIVTLYGGNDGLSTVIPFADNAYHDARPDLAYAPEEVIPIDDQLGFNPVLKGLHKLWDEQKLAIVRGVTYPKPSRSHFRSMDIWQSASPLESVPTGWIGRWLDATGDDPVRAINIGAVLPPMAVGEKYTASALARDMSPLPAEVVAALDTVGVDDPRDTAAMTAIRTAYRSSRAFGSALEPVIVSGDTAVSGGTNVGGLTSADLYGKNTLAAQLNVVSRCVKAAVPSRVYMVSLGGFDLHTDERESQQQLLSVVDEALTPFLREMRTDPHGKDVVVMVYSEFGRRVRANASYGTDHGTAGPVFICGQPVKGGFYGEQPSLTDLDDGDLKGDTDFRDIYHELLVHTIGTDPEPVIGPGRRDIGFLG
ncbi:DUF1501 domain-containing protein [Mycobacterium sp. 3519A]|uniref:DUF1501 domain-containing protein n=1 Tax=Mycobacterium sp. 3519A TaxID=2057184 RepID=UPI000C7D7068|nr:DUF1501 domain-containing protein [Mycobacterium sp. 3519A]